MKAIKTVIFFLYRERQKLFFVSLMTFLILFSCADAKAGWVTLAKRTEELMKQLSEREGKENSSETEREISSIRSGIREKFEKLRSGQEGNENSSGNKLSGKEETDSDMAPCRIRGIELFDMKDYQTAFLLFSTAAENGDAEAQCYLYTMYKNGLGVEQSDELAEKWLDESANQGFLRAVYEREFKNNKEDPEKALQDIEREYSDLMSKLGD